MGFVSKQVEDEKQKLLWMDVGRQAGVLGGGGSQAGDEAGRKCL